MMRRFVFAALAALPALFAFSSCDDDSGKLPDNVSIYINGQDKTNKALSSEALTVSEICRGDSLVILEQYADGSCGNAICTIVVNPNDEGNMAIDTINNRICMNAREVNLESNSWLYKDSRFLILNGHSDGMGAFLGDTLAYVPHVQHNAAVDKLNELFVDREGNWTEIYKIFTEAFIFVPCTAEEYRELKAAGLE